MADKNSPPPRDERRAFVRVRFAQSCVVCGVAGVGARAAKERGSGLDREVAVESIRECRVGVEIAQGGKLCVIPWANILTAEVA